MDIQAEALQPAYLRNQIVMVERINNQPYDDHLAGNNFNILALQHSYLGVITGHDITGARERIISAKTNDPFVDHFKKLDVLAKLEDNWDSEGAESPNEVALFSCRQVLEGLLHEGFLPTNIAPSVEGGVGLYFIKGNKYADIECLNTGEILAVTSDRVTPADVWETSIEDVEESTKKIRTFLNG